MPITSLIAALHARAAKGGDKAAAALAEALRALIVRLEDGLLTREEWDAYGMGEMLAMAEQAIRESGVNAAFADAFGREAAGFAQAIDAGIEAVNFGREDATALQAILRMKFDGWGRTVATEITDFIRSQVASATLAPVSTRSIRERLVGQFGPKLETHANTYVHTAMEQQLRETWVVAGDNAGVKTYHYEGPDDLITRPFCREQLDRGGSYTLEEIRAMDNGQGLPVLESGGGWNCRHMWIPDF